MKVVVSFDLANADSEDYGVAYEVLGAIGLFPITLNKGVSLPSTTVMGNLRGDVPVGTLRDFIWDAFTRVGLTPSSIFGGVLQDWAVTTK